MAAFADLVRFIPTLGGTTDWTYSSAVGGCQSPAAAGVQNGLAYKVYAVSNDLTQWEISEGAYNSGTGVFARTTVLYNSSGTGAAAGQTGAGTKINFSTVPQVSVVALAEDLISVDIAKGRMPGCDGSFDAAAGQVGEYWNTALPYGSRITLSPGVYSSIAALTNLTPGDWDVSGIVLCEGTGGPVATYLIVATDFAGTDAPYGPTLSATVTDVAAILPPQRVKITANTTINLKINTDWTGGTSVKAWGRIWARRIR